MSNNSMKHIWSILCQSSSIDSGTNLLSIFNCVEELSLVVDKDKIKNEELVIPVKFQLVSLWGIENSKIKNELEISVNLLDPDGAVVGHIQNDFDIDKGFSRFRSFVNFEGLKITKEGRYSIEINQKKGNKTEKVAELPLDVKIAYK